MYVRGNPILASKFFLSFLKSYAVRFRWIPCFPCQWNSVFCHAVTADGWIFEFGHEIRFRHSCPLQDDFWLWEELHQHITFRLSNTCKANAIPISLSWTQLAFWHWQYSISKHCCAPVSQFRGRIFGGLSLKWNSLVHRGFPICVTNWSFPLDSDATPAPDQA